MLSCVMGAWSDTSSSPQPGHSLPVCSCCSFNSGDLCVLLTWLSGGTGGKHPWPRGEEGELHQPQVLLHLSRWHRQLEPKLNLSCKNPQVHPACPQSLVFLRDRVWLLHGPAAGEWLPPHLRGHQAPEAHLVPAGLQEEKFMAAYKVQGRVK